MRSMVIGNVCCVGLHADTRGVQIRIMKIKGAQKRSPTFTDTKVNEGFRRDCLDQFKEAGINNNKSQVVVND